MERRAVECALELADVLWREGVAASVWYDDEGTIWVTGTCWSVKVHANAARTETKGEVPRKVVSVLVNSGKLRNEDQGKERRCAHSNSSVSGWTR